MIGGNGIYSFTLRKALDGSAIGKDCMHLLKGTG